METILEIDNLSKEYADFKLDNVSFNLKRGYIMGIIGPNGAGKTTTIKLIMNLISLPVNRLELAKAKLLTLLIVYGTTTFLSIILYVIYILLGFTEKTGILIIMVQLLATFLLSVFLGLVGIAVKNTFPVLIIIILLLNSVHITSVTSTLQIGQNTIIDILILLILLGFSRFVYNVVKENIIKFYSDMEL